MKLEFGFLSSELDLSVGPISVKTLSNLDLKCSAILQSGQAHRDWVYAPRCASSDSSGKTIELPFHSRVFGLPKTHAIEHSAADCKEHVEFLVWCLSFFTGIRLTCTEAGYVDAAPLKPHALTDFVLHPSSEADALALGEAFWRRAPSWENAKLIVAMIHSLFVSQSPQSLQYERFFHAYAAIDAGYAYLKRAGLVQSATHSARIAKMCEHFKMDTPAWAIFSGRNSPLAEIRNPTFHEALFAGEPLGFAIYASTQIDSGADQNLLLEMEALICRLLVAILGKPDCEYVKSAVTTRQLHGLDLRRT